MDYAYPVVQANAHCAQCSSVTEAVAAEADFERWFSFGVPIQEAMPEATPDTREAFIGWRSNFYICPACWPEEPEG